MRLGLRLLFAFFLINGIAAFFVLRVFTAEIKPSVREVMEDMMVDTANLLAELASDDLASGRLAAGAQAAPGAPESDFARHVRRYAGRPIDATIWGLSKQTLDFRIYVTDERGRVLFDTERRAVGEDYSQWRDVARTLRGEYGARATRDVQADDTSGVMYVAAPIWIDDGGGGRRIGGVLTVAKPTRTVQRFIDRAEHKVLKGGLLLLALSACVGVGVTVWTVWHVRRLRDYALSVQAPGDGAGPPPAVPRVPGELGDLARAMDRMRERLEGRDYIEGYVRALTHELKSPVAALRGAGELLQDDLPAGDRRQFATQVVEQSERLQRLIDRLLELSKLEQRQHAEAGAAPVALRACAEAALRQCEARARQRGVRLELAGEGASGPWEAELVTLALGNLIDNAIDFSPGGGTVHVALDGASVSVRDEGPGVPDYALPRLGERFFTTARPDGSRSGSGLGLAIVKRVMALHGGRFSTVASPRGFHVRLSLPSP
ncbi:two-component system sensor histidine kinase CreC [Paracidovorax anthurii]|uniref:histidine kinase n=1 Tax=Paracidovorax anthurii TaxID=78229 RepID=A0A328ZM03_9BURK|nr:two-component system sensor histidine kinase CreC [Paracidovorax anthurii]RAR86435.1 two-component system sensor histidine kinase CreC [Paracidovorax anthurii]